MKLSNLKYNPESGDQPGTGGLSPTLPLQFSDERQPD